jgi:hypothetical protein
MERGLEKIAATVLMSGGIEGLNQRDDERPGAKVAPGEGQSVRKSKGREWPASSVGDLLNAEEA